MGSNFKLSATLTIRRPKTTLRFGSTIFGNFEEKKEEKKKEEIK
jgi:hypothetical protein